MHVLCCPLRVYPLAQALPLVQAYTVRSRLLLRSSFAYFPSERCSWLCVSSRLHQLRARVRWLNALECASVLCAFALLAAYSFRSSLQYSSIHYAAAIIVCRLIRVLRFMLFGYLDTINDEDADNTEVGCDLQDYFCSRCRPCVFLLDCALRRFRPKTLSWV